MKTLIKIILIILLTVSPVSADALTDSLNTAFFIDMLQTIEISNQGLQESNPILKPMVDNKNHLGIIAYFIGTSILVNTIIKSIDNKNTRKNILLGINIIEWSIVISNNQAGIKIKF